MSFNRDVALEDAKLDAVRYLTASLKDPVSGKHHVEELVSELGCVVESYPEWHPILNIPREMAWETSDCLQNISLYEEVDHTVLFLRGFITCPYSEESANRLVDKIRKTPGLSARRLEYCLYNDSTFPVVVKAVELETEFGGFVNGKVALEQFLKVLVRYSIGQDYADTWWTLRGRLLGTPCGEDSSAFVDRATGQQMRKILETLNETGVFGVVRDLSLDMLSNDEQHAVGSNIIAAAIEHGDDSTPFMYRGELFDADVRDVFGTRYEFAVQVKRVDGGLYVRGLFYPENSLCEVAVLQGSETVAKKFI